MKSLKHRDIIKMDHAVTGLKSYISLVITKQWSAPEKKTPLHITINSNNLGQKLSSQDLTKLKSEMQIIV